MRSALLCLAVLSISCAKKPSSSDVQPTIRVLEAASSASVDDATRLLFAGCSEIPACAQGCAKELDFCASPDNDESQRATVLASCSGVDYRARRDKGEALTPSQWARQHMTSFLDGVAKVASEAEQKRLAELRAATKL